MEKHSMAPNDYTWREYRTNVVMFSKRPVFINSLVTKMPSYLHHCSMYGITREDAEYQMEICNTRNRSVVHYSSELVIDTDNHETAEKVWHVLCAEDYSFELWKLNNYKFFVKRDESDFPSATMVYQDRIFVIGMFASCNIDKGLDTGIYRSPFALCRARNSIHEVTKAKSVIVAEREGENRIKTGHLEIKKYDKAINVTTETNRSDWEKFQAVISHAKGKHDNKHTCLWALARDFVEFLTFEAALEVAGIYARSMDYSEEKAERAVTQAYEQYGNMERDRDD